MAKIRVRARAVDMLGRQQIAGIPTAIHELFKNAHDAYAERVEVDYFRGDGAFVLRDDGYGMRPKEFEEKWLTIGTESKIDANESTSTLPSYLGEQALRRPILGEKGIGRLAIATIGPQVLVLTRAIRDDGLDDLVVSFVHWGLFELPGIDVDQIEIPVETMPGGVLPDLKFVKTLVDRVRENLSSLSGNVPQRLYDKILHQLDTFFIDPSVAETVLEGPSLKGKGHGTHFYIQPTDKILESDIDESSDIATPLQRTLLGFSNTMIPGRSRPPVLTKFRDHLCDGNINELIGEYEFFTPEEFSEADHHFVGKFDEYGQFSGELTLYKQAPVEYQVAWPEAHGRKTDCGPFDIKIAYVQGDPKESRLSPEDYANIYRKLKLIGGLYIYKDGIRILPYGNSDYDFLNIEVRRAKAAKDWFFAYRRMYGAVELTHIDNVKLVEKAGREGFRTNKAYRQLKAILENFFMQLAKDYFRPGSLYGEEYRAIKAQFVKDAETLKKRNKRLQARKKAFADSLNDFFHALETGEPSSSANSLRTKALRNINAIREIDIPEEAARALLKVESTLRKAVSKLRNEYKISRIRGVGLTKKQVGDWDAYQKNFEKLEVEVFAPLEKEINETINEVAENSAVALDRRRRIEQSLEDVSSTKKREVATLTREIKNEVDKLSQDVIQEAQKRLASIYATITTTYKEFAQVETAELPDEELALLQKKLLEQITTTAAQESDALGDILHQIQSLAEAIKGDGGFEDETAALESTLASKIEELDTYSDLAQVGSAVGIVHHELHGVIKGVRKNFQKLRPWAKTNEKLQGIYTDLKGSFENLDTYLKLFTPLSRRLNREKVDINGERIRKYLLDIFDSRIIRYNVKFIATDQFKAKSVKGFPSTLYPTFVNIVDNAIYWMTSEKDAGTRELILDADEQGYLIKNSGPGIPTRHAERIFDFGISRKTGGRGMGLYISRESLRKENFDLTLENPGENNHPTFRISMKEQNSQGEDE